MLRYAAMLACVVYTTSGAAQTQDSSSTADTVRRVRRPVTAELLASAYSSDAARDLLRRARLARRTADSALVAYDARSSERVTASGSIGVLTPDRVLGQRETAARVRWSRTAGAHIEVLGRRRDKHTGLPLPNPMGDDLAPVPYWPGRDALWIPGASSGGLEADTTDLVHPLSSGAEAHYRYAVGDSVTLTLGQGRTLLLRELRIKPREPRWNLSVGSYWFNDATAELVRAGYTLAVPYDVWPEVSRARGPNEQGPPWYARFFAQPLKAELQGVTVEYGLYAGRFWLPRVQRADAMVQAGPAKLTLTIEQSFQYDQVNGDVSVPEIPAERWALRARGDSLNALYRAIARDTALARDSVAAKARRRELDSLGRAITAEITAARRASCAATGVYYRTNTRVGTQLRTAIAEPCDSVALYNSPALSLNTNADTRYAVDRAELLERALARGNAEWQPASATWHYGLEYLRFNRVEGLSAGLARRQVLGLGFSTEVNARISLADATLNGEILAFRSNANGVTRVGVFRRLVQADDYGRAFNPFASVANFLSAQDEQFYYRATGVELARASEGRGVGSAKWEWRLFAEDQRRAFTNHDINLPGLLRSGTGNRWSQYVIDTLASRSGIIGGAALVHTAGLGSELTGWRIGTQVRAEAVGGAWAYGRAAADVGVSTLLGPLRPYVGVSGGTSVGDMPVHRWWNVGGWQTVRGFAGGTNRGTAYYMARTELSWRRGGWFQPHVGADLGWAGDRSLVAESRPLSNAGAGVALFGLPIRFDVVRTLAPVQGWRSDFYAAVRF
jgi:hypothetical protein